MDMKCQVMMFERTLTSFWHEHYLHVCLCAHECLGEHEELRSDPAAAGELIASPFVFVQVFGDYYHFRHHAVVKRALSGHKGMHIRLQKEPQVRLLSALTQLSATTKGQKTDWIRHRGCVYHKRKGCQHQWQLVKLCILCSPHRSFHLSPAQSKILHSCKYAK